MEWCCQTIVSRVFTLALYSDPITPPITPFDPTPFEQDAKYD